MLGTNSLEQRMLDDTLTLFRQGGFPTPTDGMLLIDGWLQALQGNLGTDIVEARLRDLRDALHADGQPNAGHLRTLLLALSDQAAHIAQGDHAEGTWTGKLQSLSVILRDLSQQLS